MHFFNLSFDFLSNGFLIGIFLIERSSFSFPLHFGNGGALLYYEEGFAGKFSRGLLGYWEGT